MTVHAARDHAEWSASATERNWACPGALTLTAGLPERPNEAADWGTCCHQVAEKCLRNGNDAIEYIGTVEKGKTFENEVDEEMAETAQMYVDYVRSRNADKLFVEQKFSLSSLNPPFEAGGTADAVVYTAAEKLLEVIDLKGGRGVVVEIEGNPQLRTYALGALLANPDLDAETVKVTIVQPRAHHKSGRIRSETFHTMELLYDWTSDLLQAMGRAKAAKDAYGKVPAWASTYLKAGDHCKFCKVAGACPALQQRVYDTARVWFDDQDKPRISNSPDAMSPEALAMALDAADMIGDWLNAVRAFAHAQAESGITIPNYILVQKESREKWFEGNDAVAAEKAIAAGLPEEKVFNAPKIRTPKQIRDALKKAKLSDVAEEIKDLSGTETTGTNLVRADNTSREAVKPSAHKHFDIIN